MVAHRRGRAIFPRMATTPAERKALMFLGAVAVLGVGARAVAEVRGDAPAVGAMQPALERQLARAEGAARREKAEREEREARSRAGGKGRARGGGKRGRPAASKKDASPAVIDVDTADSLALATLPGVGPALARRIVQDRLTRGPFGGTEALDLVPGVGPRLLKGLAGRVTFSGPRRPTIGNGQPGGPAARERAGTTTPAGRRRRGSR
jgi:DNA uptake protein ComE-like DNA-binding protein